MHGKQPVTVGGTQGYVARIVGSLPGADAARAAVDLRGGAVRTAGAPGGGR
jgi:hypothetical protein